MVEDLLKEGVWWSTARTQSSAGILHVAWVGWVAALIKRCLQKSKQAFTQLEELVNVRSLHCFNLHIALKGSIRSLALSEPP